MGFTKQKKEIETAPPTAQDADASDAAQDAKAELRGLSFADGEKALAPNGIAQQTKNPDEDPEEALAALEALERKKGGPGSMTQAQAAGPTKAAKVTKAPARSPEETEALKLYAKSAERYGANVTDDGKKAQDAKKKGLSRR